MRILSLCLVQPRHKACASEPPPHGDSPQKVREEKRGRKRKGEKTSASIFAVKRALLCLLFEQRQIRPSLPPLALGDQDSLQRAKLVTSEICGCSKIGSIESSY